MDQDWINRTMPVPDAEDSARSQSEECPVCHDTGVMRWQQPSLGPNGETVLREMEHPCVNGCEGDWKYPAAETSAVVNSPDDLPDIRESGPVARVRGQADEANEIGTDFIVEFVRSRGFKWGER
jgi:hypothetical protein